MTRVPALVLIGVAAAVALPKAQTSPLVKNLYVTFPFNFFGSRAPADAVVTIDDDPVTVRSVTAGPQPLDAVVLVDASDSMPVGPSGSQSPDLLKLAHRLGSLAHDTERIRLGTFGKKLLIGRALLQSPAQADSAIEEVAQRGGPSPVWDAIDGASTSLDQPGAALRLVVVFSDGRATGNDLGLEKVVTRAVSSGTTVSVVAIGDKLLAGSGVRIIGRNDGLKRMADESGGAFFELRDDKDLPIDSIAGLVTEARGRHRLEIEYPYRDFRQHRLAVRIGQTVLRAPAHISR